MLGWLAPTNAGCFGFISEFEGEFSDSGLDLFYQAGKQAYLGPNWYLGHRQPHLRTPHAERVIPLWQSSLLRPLVSFFFFAAPFFVTSSSPPRYFSLCLTSLVTGENTLSSQVTFVQL